MDLFDINDFVIHSSCQLIGVGGDYEAQFCSRNENVPFWGPEIGQNRKIWTAPNHEKLDIFHD